MNNMKLLQKSYVKYGLLMTAVIVLCLFLMEVTGQNKTVEHSPYVVFFTMIAPFIIWFFALREKKKQLKGKMSFKQGVVEGFKVSLVYAIVSPFVFLFYYCCVNPAIIPAVGAAYQLKGATNEVIIATDMAVQFIAAIIGGTIYAAILSFFLKSKKK
jgi:hypothetical protein